MNGAGRVPIRDGRSAPSHRSTPLLSSGAVDIAAIADYLGVTRQRVYQLAPTPDFPAPVEDVVSREWDPAEIEAWAQRAWWHTKPWRQPPHDPVDHRR